jgi:hypothetical protein
MDDDKVPMLVRLPFDLLPEEAQTFLISLRVALQQYTDYRAAQITFEELQEPTVMSMNNVIIDVYVPRLT